MRIRYTPRDLADLTAILTYLERHSPQGAQNVARAMRKTIDLIGQFPQ
jgi:plasmid stabilization system protein ParE